jgi:hypothetical protein
MTLYSVVLFVHVASAFGIAAALSLAAVTLARLRRATTVGEVCLWIEFAPGVPALAIVALVFLLLSGIYMTAQMGGWSLAWPKVALGALILIGPLGAIPARRLRAIQVSCAASRPNESEILAKLRDPFLVFSMNMRIALVLGILLLMTAKPEMRQSLGVIVSSILLGLVATVFWRRDAASPIARAESRQ